MGLGVRFPPGAPRAIRCAQMRGAASHMLVQRMVRVLNPTRSAEEWFRTASLSPTDACSSRNGTPRHICGDPGRCFGQLAQLVRASRLHREGRRFDSYVAHQLVSSLLAPRIRLLPNLLRSRNEASLYPTNACSSRSGTARHIRGGPEGRATCAMCFIIIRRSSWALSSFLRHPTG